MLHVANGQGESARLDYSVIDQIQFAGSLMQRPLECSCDPDGVHRLRLSLDHLKPDRQYAIKVLEAALDDRGRYSFKCGPRVFAAPLTLPPVPAATLAAATDLVLEYTRGPPPRVRVRLGAALCFDLINN